MWQYSTIDDSLIAGFVGTPFHCKRSALGNKGKLHEGRFSCLDKTLDSLRCTFSPTLPYCKRFLTSRRPALAGCPTTPVKSLHASRDSGVNTMPPYTKLNNADSGRPGGGGYTETEMVSTDGRGRRPPSRASRVTRPV